MKSARPRNAGGRFRLTSVGEGRLVRRMRSRGWVACSKNAGLAAPARSDAFFSGSGALFCGNRSSAIRGFAAALHQSRSRGCQTGVFAAREPAKTCAAVAWSDSRGGWLAPSSASLYVGFDTSGFQRVKAPVLLTHWVLPFARMDARDGAGRNVKTPARISRTGVFGWLEVACCEGFRPLRTAASPQAGTPCRRRFSRARSCGSRPFLRTTW